MRIYTIGYEGTTVGEFLAALQLAAQGGRRERRDCRLIRRTLELVTDAARLEPEAFQERQGERQEPRRGWPVTRSGQLK